MACVDGGGCKLGRYSDSLRARSRSRNRPLSFWSEDTFMVIIISDSHK
jgi:hypothetical protein